MKDRVVTGPQVITEAQEIGAPAEILESLLTAPEAAPPRVKEARIALPSGRAVEARATDGDERVTVRGISGEVELEVVLTPRGPLLRFRAADLELSTAGAVRVDCDTFHVRADRGITAETGGAVSISGAEARVEATRGDVQIEANDDVKVEGERIKLNC